MGSHEDHSTFVVSRVCSAGSDPPHRVDDGIPGEVHVVGSHTLDQQAIDGALRRRKVQGRQLRREPAVQLLREGIIKAVGAQPRLYMADRHAFVEGGQGGGDRGRRVSLHQREMRPDLCDDRLDPLQDRGKYP